MSYFPDTPLRGKAAKREHGAAGAEAHAHNKGAGVARFWEGNPRKGQQWPQKKTSLQKWGEGEGGTYFSLYLPLKVKIHLKNGNCSHDRSCGQGRESWSIYPSTPHLLYLRKKSTVPVLASLSVNKYKPSSMFSVAPAAVNFPHPVCDPCVPGGEKQGP